MVTRFTRRLPDRARAGLTMLEVAVSGALMGGVFLVIGLSLQSAYSSYGMADAVSQLDQKAHRALESIVRDIYDAGAGSVGGPTGINGSNTIAFRRPGGYDAATGIIWGPETRISWQLDADEDDDGIDNDGDGLIDEGEVVWTLDVDGASERSATRVRGVAEFLEGEQLNFVDDNGNGLVDEAGLVFEWDETVLTVRLTLEAVGPKGVQLTRTVQTAIRLRN